MLATLADLGYPPGDESLIPLRDQVYGWLLGASHLKGVKVLAGRARRCASQEGNALNQSDRVFALYPITLCEEKMLQS